MDRRSMMYQCLECGEPEVVKASDHKIDGRVCKSCGGYLSPIGFIGIDLAKGEDKTVITYPPG